MEKQHVVLALTNRKWLGLLFLLSIIAIGLAALGLFLPIDHNDPGPRGPSGPRGIIGGLGPTGTTGATGAAGVGATGSCGHQLLWNDATNQWESLETIYSLEFHSNGAGTITTREVDLTDAFQPSTPLFWQNAHVYLNVTQFDETSVDVTLTGSSYDPVSGVYQSVWSEVVAIDSIGLYKSTQTFALLSNVTLSIVSPNITYSLGAMNPHPLKGQLRGSRVEYDTLGDDFSGSFRVQKVQQLTNNRFQLIDLEWYSFSSTFMGPSSVTDLARGLRSFTLAEQSMHEPNGGFTIAYQDYASYLGSAALVDEIIISVNHSGESSGFLFYSLSGCQ